MLDEKRSNVNVETQHLAKSSRARDLVGTRFSRLVVLSYAGTQGKHKHIVWNVRCDCGRETVVRGSHLVSGKIASCGCFRKEFTSQKFATHRMTKTKVYRIWRQMMCRCTQPTNISFPNYGGRGIEVCRRWRESFMTFFSDMGHPPTSVHEIDRIDNDGNYEPGNCRWVTAKQNARNRRNNRVLTYDGKSMCVAEWAEHLGVERYVLSNRLRRKWTVEQTLSIKIGGKRLAR